MAIGKAGGMTPGDIIRTIAREHGVTFDDLRGPRRFKKIVAARKEAAIVLTERGMSNIRISQLLQKDKTTIFYYVNPRVLETKRPYYRRRWAERARAVQ